MKTIKSFSDIQYIINNKLDVKDFQGHNIPFVRFIQLSLLEIVNIIEAKDGEWEYPIEH